MRMMGAMGRYAPIASRACGLGVGDFLCADLAVFQGENAVTMPSIGDAKQLAAKNRLRRCVILFETEEGQVGYSSYGKTRALCQSTREIMDEIFDDLQHRVQWDSSRLNEGGTDVD